MEINGPRSVSGFGKLAGAAVLGALFWFSRGRGPKFPKSD